MMAGVAYKDIVTVLLDRFPEFKETEDFKWGIDPEIPYSVWGAFGRFITTYMRRLPADALNNDELVNRVFDFANELMDSGDDDTKTIVVIELFENFYMYRKTLELGRRKLKSKHVTWLNRQGAWLGTSDLNFEGELVAPNGLGSLEWLLSKCSWNINVIKYTDIATPRMASHDHRIELETDPGDGPKYTFFGDAGYSEAEASQLLGELSQLLIRGDVAHRIQLCRSGHADVFLECFRHRWPGDNTKNH